MPKCVLLLSGGLDSATVLAVARDLGFDVYALSVLYGQRHQVEVDAAVRVAAALGATEHRFVSVNLDTLGGSALTDSGLDVPKDRDESAMQDIPITYVPARNTVMLSLALGYAEVVGATDIFVGVNAVDYSGYPDCRPEYIAAFEHLAQLATKAGVEGKRMRIHAPLIALTKVQIIERGLSLGVDYGMTHSCYDPLPNGRACGRCDSCILRKNAFAELGMDDPVLV
ncbi:MAG: 7-cyano-7-deazaguanine synthase QueC [Armatimonadetes bacterium 55-13]|nr:7-cyano-7-deazaguanine synthase QueC [Armatimonadota bacterium]ODU51420.1 MAG: 7-cyano-7-deazaguanine synthase QueC [bacterium SCN 57-13]OJU64257.1 MAG: 7-cyano-7-deazaguanine synthase QueC [Armatimonadetes bacterium 55-13]